MHRQSEYERSLPVRECLHEALECLVPCGTSQNLHERTLLHVGIARVRALLDICRSILDVTLKAHTDSDAVPTDMIGTNILQPRQETSGASIYAGHRLIHTVEAQTSCSSFRGRAD